METEAFSLKASSLEGCSFKGWLVEGAGDSEAVPMVAKGTTGDLAFTAT